MRKVGFMTKLVAAAVMTAVPVASSAVAAVRPGSALAGSANSISLAGASAVQGNSEDARDDRGGIPLIPLFVILATIAVGIWIASDKDNNNRAISLG